MHDVCSVACIEDVPCGYVNVFTAHPNIGFHFGAERRDPGGLLVGSGMRMRHVKRSPGEEPDFAALSALLDAA